MAIQPGRSAAIEPEPRSGSEKPSTSVDRYTDVLRLGIHFQTVIHGDRAVTQVWDRGGYYRPVLTQGRGRIELGPIEPGTDCALRFGLGVEGEIGAAPLRAQVGQRAASEASPHWLWEVELRAAPPHGWIDGRLSLPIDPNERSQLVLEVEPAAGSQAQVGWAAPHIVCRVPRSLARPLGRPHVLLISLDTLRRDHLGLYGYQRDTSPVLDALAERSWVFDRAFAPAPWTLPSHASLLTGVLPSVHQAGHSSPNAPLPADGVATLAEQLRDAGYWTIGFTAGGLVTQRNGLSRGFQWWTEQTRANLADVLPGFLDAVGTSPQKPLFLFLHTYDIHGPYAYLPGADRITVPPRGGATPGEAARCEFCSDAEWERVRSLRYDEYQRLDRFRSLAEVVGAYDRGIRFVDAQLGVLFDRLREIGILDDTMIVVTSDHGESLYDRGAYIGHSYTLYDEEIRVPLLVRLPGGDRGRSAALVELSDVAPWILDVAGVARPAVFADRGPPAWQPGTVPSRTVVQGEAAHSGQRYARSEDGKWIAAAPAGAHSLVPPELRERLSASDQAFDLARDPGESNNLLTAAPQPAAGPAAELRSVAESSSAPGQDNQKPAPAMDAATEQRLRELGYLR